MRKTNIKIIYSCYWGSYLAVVAASLHLGYISVDGYNENDILALHLYNKIKDNQLGELFFIGMDDKGREIYIIGSKNSGKILKKTLKGIAEIYGFKKDTVLFIDTNPYYNNLTLLGILMIRWLGFTKVGMRLVLRGIGNNHDKLREVVKSVRDLPC
jgi:hypothetical protein